MMNENRKPELNGRRVKKLRERVGLTQLQLSEFNFGNSNKMHLSTVKRIEKDDCFPAKKHQIDFLAQALNVPSLILLNEPSELKVATVNLYKINTGRDLTEWIQKKHGVIWKLPIEPKSKEARSAILSFCERMDKELGDAYQRYPKRKGNILEQLQTDYINRDSIDELKANGISVFAGSHYIWQPIVSVDEDAVCWAGVFTQEQVKEFEKTEGFFESKSFRDVLAFSFIDETEDKLETDQILETYEIDPGNLLQVPEKEFWNFTIERIENGEEPLDPTFFKVMENSKKRAAKE